MLKKPDIEKAAGLQKEVSDIEAKLDQKWVEHMMKMKGMFPNVGRGFMGADPRAVAQATAAAGDKYIHINP